KGAVTIDFHSLEAPDGQEVPIEAHIYGEANRFYEADSRVLPLEQHMTDEAVRLEPSQPRSQGQRFIVEQPQADPQGQLSSTTGLVPVKGMITGAWVDQPLSKSEQHNHTARLLMNKGSVFSIPQGTELELETDATTSIAVAAPIASL
ncbi:MAG: hypothetical protein K2Z81_16295, partial [Cyanobacteria bacterium]|nr:hypothetical protein [Cyanobacteriota bacterium]